MSKGQLLFNVCKMIKHKEKGKKNNFEHEAKDLPQLIFFD